MFHYDHLGTSFQIDVTIFDNILCFLRTEFMLAEKKTITNQIKRLQVL
jgi:hypothetical protein